RYSRPIENPSLLAELAKGTRSFRLRTPPQLLEMHGQGSPVLVGIFRPAILMPAVTLSRLNPSERAMVIGHELAHIPRGDLFWSLIVALVRAVFFFHPLALLSERKTAVAQEIATDALAIARQQDNDPVNYGTLLVSIVSKLGPGRLIPTMSVGTAE